MSDHMELGDTGMIPEEDGWYKDKRNGNRVDPEGRVYDNEGEMIWDPVLDEEYDRDES